MQYTNSVNNIIEPSSIKQWDATLDYLNKLKTPPRRVLCFGKAGSGKTTWACSLMAHYERVTLTASMFPDALLGKFLLKGGSTEWVNAFATRAAMSGVPLVIDEIHKQQGELDSTLNMILDDASICSLNLDNGQAITPAAGFRVLATMNGSPEQLDETLLDRFDVVLRCDTPHAGILRRLSPESAAYLTNKMANEPRTAEEWVPKQSTRNFLSFENLRAQGVSDKFAADLIFGEGQGAVVLNSMIDAVRNSK